MQRSSSTMTPVKSLGLAAALGACVALGATLPACAAEQATGEAQPEVVATVAGQPITQGELDAATAETLARLEEQMRRQLEDQKQKILEQQLEQLIEQKLLAVEAAARNVGADALVATEVGAVTDAEIDGFYEENKNRMQGRTKEQMADAIRSFLEQQKRQGYIASLKEKHKVRILLEPKRVEVDYAGAPTKGPADAPVTIVEFSDFQCPYCSRLNPTLAQVMETYGGKVQIAFRQFPLNNIHPDAQKAAEASLCAHDQGKFWPMHDAMFADQQNLAVEQLKAKAAELGLDAGQFDQCLDSGKHQAAVAQDLQDGQSSGVTGTPAMFVNGRFISGAVPFEQVAEIIDDELARKGAE